VLKLISCLCWMKTRKILGGHCSKLRKLGAPGISLGIFSNIVVKRCNVLDQRTVDTFNNGSSRKEQDKLLHGLDSR